MLANTWTNIIITDTNQTQGITSIIRQTIEFHLCWNVITIYELVSYWHIKLYQAIHLRLNLLLLLAGRLVIDYEGHLTLLALDMGILATLATKHTNHQLVEQMLSRMSRRELLLMMLVQYNITFLHLDIEFIDSYSVSIHGYREYAILFQLNLLLASREQFGNENLLFSDLEEIESMTRDTYLKLASLLGKVEHDEHHLIILLAKEGKIGTWIKAL